MKKAILTTCALIIFQINYAQNFNNEIGISFGAVSFHLDQEENNTPDINSVFHTSNAHIHQLPKLYFSKRIYNRWKARFTTRISQQRFTTNDETELNKDRLHSPQVDGDLLEGSWKNTYTEIGVGLQYAIIQKTKSELYIAVNTEITRRHERSFWKIQSNELTRHDRYQGSQTIWNGGQITLLLGYKKNITDCISASIEAGINKNYLSPVSRCSINYHF